MQAFLTNAGYVALILFAFAEACCIPISSEVTFGFAGVLAYQGHLSLILVIATGVAAELAGSYVAYTAGRVVDRPVLERAGRYLLLTRSDFGRAERFLAGRGGWAVPVGRMLPLVRSFVSLGAGIAGVPARRFGLLSLPGTVAFVTAIACVGYAVGPAWTRISHDMSVAGYALAAIVVLALVAGAAYRFRALRREAGRLPAPVSPVSPPEPDRAVPR